MRSFWGKLQFCAILAACWNPHLALALTEDYCQAEAKVRKLTEKNLREWADFWKEGAARAREENPKANSALGFEIARQLNQFLDLDMKDLLDEALLQQKVKFKKSQIKMGSAERSALKELYATPEMKYAKRTPALWSNWYDAKAHLTEKLTQEAVLEGQGDEIWAARFRAAHYFSLAEAEVIQRTAIRRSFTKVALKLAANTGFSLLTNFIPDLFAFPTAHAGVGWVESPVSFIQAAYLAPKEVCGFFKQQPQAAKAAMLKLDRFFVTNRREIESRVALVFSSDNERISNLKESKKFPADESRMEKRERVFLQQSQSGMVGG